MRSRPRRLPRRAGALPLAALLGLTVAATAAAAPPPSDGVVDLLTAANAEIVGPSANARVGAVGGGGDVNGDGRADVLVGSSQVSPAGRERAGSVWVLAGRTQPADVDLAAPGPLALARIDGAAPFDELGQRSVTVAGDINADGVADILVGAPGADDNGRVGSGSAYVVFGKPGLGDVDLAALGHVRRAHRRRGRRPGRGRARGRRGRREPRRGRRPPARHRAPDRGRSRASSTSSSAARASPTSTWRAPGRAR